MLLDSNLKCSLKENHQQPLKHLNGLPKSFTRDLKERNSLHALCSLPCDIDKFDHLEFGLNDVEMVIQTGALTPLGNNGQLWLCGIAHEK